MAGCPKMLLVKYLIVKYKGMMQFVTKFVIFGQELEECISVLCHDWGDRSFFFSGKKCGRLSGEWDVGVVPLVRWYVPLFPRWQTEMIQAPANKESPEMTANMIVFKNILITCEVIYTFVNYSLWKLIFSQSSRRKNTFSAPFSINLLLTLSPARAYDSTHD